MIEGPLRIPPNLHLSFIRSSDGMITPGRRSSEPQLFGLLGAEDAKARAAAAARAGVERGTLPLLPQVSTHMPKRMNSKIIKQRSALVNPLPGSRLARPEPGKVKQSQDRTLVLVKGRGKYEGGIKS